MPTPVPFLPGEPPSQAELLARYLPPVPDGAVTQWLSGRIPSGAWLLDPFGASPRTAVEAARLGYRVLVAANNPIARFLLELAAAPPTREELHAALAELAAARKGDERLEPHIRALYATTCAGCGLEVQAEAFLWDRGASAPYGRIYHCPHCGTGGEQPATEVDVARAAQFSGGGLHRARALERVAPRNDPDRSHVEEALNVYLPRAVYSLFTLINKLDSLNLPPARRRCLEALLLYACDAANTLWPYPAGRARPRQLTIPPRFRENNVWLALEEAIEIIALDGGSEARLPSLRVSVWPEALPSLGGICIFEGRLKDLGEQVSTSSVLSLDSKAVVAALPRPNQAYWTLSALWAGWLWGPEAVGPFKSVLRRRRYDWAWHSTALHAALKNLSPLLEAGTPLFFLTGEAEPGFLNAALVSAQEAGYHLSGLALRENHQVQITWSHSTGPHAAKDEPAQPLSGESPVEVAVRAARETLRQRAEPAGYLKIQAAALQALVEDNSRWEALKSGDDPDQDSPTPAEIMTRLNGVLEEAFTYRGGFVRFGGSEKSLEAGTWWLRGTEPDGELPLADRVEMEVVRYLLKHPGASLPEVDREICAAFPGLLTPSRELVVACLTSYALEDPPGSGSWKIRPEDEPRERRKDLVEMAALMRKIASRLGFTAEGRSPFIWRDASGAVQYTGHITASAVLGEIVIRQAEEKESPPGRGLIIIPGGRANLAAFKLGRDHRLKAAVESGWRFVKFRQLRWLAENPSLSPERFEELLSQDSLSYDAAQMRLF